MAGKISMVVLLFLLRVMNEMAVTRSSVWFENVLQTSEACDSSLCYMP